MRPQIFIFFCIAKQIIYLFIRFRIGMKPLDYSYDYRRPRWNNPTYLSGGVTTSLAVFAELPKKNTTLNNDVNNSNSPSQKANMNNTYENHQIPISSPRQQGQKLSPSKLSTYGTNLLNQVTLLKTSNSINDKQIYDRLQKRFNIITNKPKVYEQSIHQYPKFTLEDKDLYYYKRLKQQNQEQNSYKSTELRRSGVSNSGNNRSPRQQLQKQHKN